MNIKNRLAFWLINKGISLLPKESRTLCFILNCVYTKKIKLEVGNV